jgi:hypothetical protein
MDYNRLKLPWENKLPVLPILPDLFQVRIILGTTSYADVAVRFQRTLSELGLNDKDAILSS